MKCLIIFFICSFSLSAQNNWEEVYFFDPISTIVDIDCFNENSIFISTGYGGILNSLNIGNDWTQIRQQSYENDIIKFSVTDTNNLFLLSRKHTLMKSSDGGKTFETIVLPKTITGVNLDFKMYNSDIGLVSNQHLAFTKDSWKNIDTIDTESNLYYVSNSEFINDSNLYLVTNKFYDVKKGYEYSNFDKNYFSIINLNKKDIVDISKIKIQYDLDFSTLDMKVFNNKMIYLAGNHSWISGGTSTSFIIKTEDGGLTWKVLLDIYLYKVNLGNIFEGEGYGSPSAIESIEFKNDSVGIAAGKFGTLLYTYDSGNSWYYEKYPDKTMDTSPIFKTKYCGDNLFLTDMGRKIYRLKEDVLAPLPQDTFTIDGYISGDKMSIVNIPVALDNRITMTDENGYYKFTQVRGTNFELKVLNKYFEYFPFSYTPSKINVSITNDTTINFSSDDLREFYNFSGSVLIGNEGLENIGVELLKVDSKSIKTRDTVYTNEDGFYIFENKENFKYQIRPFSEEYTFIPDKLTYTLNENITTPYAFIATPHSSITQNPNFQLRDNVLISEEVAGMHYRIISLSGRVVKSAHLPKELNLNAHPTGTYILQITKSEQVIFTHKFQVLR